MLHVEGAVEGLAETKAEVEVDVEVEVDSRLDRKCGGMAIAGGWEWRIEGSTVDNGERNGDEGADSYRLDVGDTDIEYD